MSIRHNKTVRFAAVGAVLALSLAACSADDASTETSTGGSSSSAPAPETGESMEATASAPFGPGCEAVPAEGAGSFDGMAAEPVATAASANPLLSTLVSAVGEADLVDTLNSAEEVTVFAPTNDAFEAMDQATLKKAMGDPSGLLTQVLTYHVVEGKLAPEELAGTHTTLQGTDLTVEGGDEDFTVGGSASVICGNVQTSNATVYIIDGVLAPKA